jgi:hypothetical protein
LDGCLVRVGEWLVMIWGYSPNHLKFD